MKNEYIAQFRYYHNPNVNRVTLIRVKTPQNIINVALLQDAWGKKVQNLEYVCFERLPHKKLWNFRLVKGTSIEIDFAEV